MLAFERAKGQRQGFHPDIVQEGIGEGEFIPHAHGVVNCQRGQSCFGKRQDHPEKHVVFVAEFAYVFQKGVWQITDIIYLLVFFCAWEL